MMMRLQTSRIDDVRHLMTAHHRYRFIAPSHHRRAPSLSTHHHRLSIYYHSISQHIGSVQHHDSLARRCECYNDGFFVTDEVVSNSVSNSHLVLALYRQAAAILLISRRLLTAPTSTHCGSLIKCAHLHVSHCYTSTHRLIVRLRF